MVNGLDVYEIRADYISFLQTIDCKVPKIDYSSEHRYNKFLCGIVLNIGYYEYFAPISSCKIHKVSSFVIKVINGNDISSIRFSFMIPVPLGIATIKIIKNELSPNIEIY
jgi:protein AbiQ